MPRETQSRRRQPKSNTPKINVNSYYGNRENIGSTSSSPFQKQATKKVRSHILAKIVDLAILLILVACLIYSLIVSPQAKVAVDLPIYHPLSEYASFSMSKLSGLENKNKITFNKERLAKDLIGEFPEIRNVNIELPIFGQKPVIRIYVAKPAFLLRSEGREYLLISNGVALGQKEDYKNLPSLITIDDESGYKITVGQKILSDNDILFLQTLNAQLNRRKVSLKNLVLSKSPQEVNLYTEDAKYYTKFYMGGDASLQAGQYLAAKNAFKSQPPPSTYLDVRVSGKIFYK
jgi:hypothetical protein